MLRIIDKDVFVYMFHGIERFRLAYNALVLAMWFCCFCIDLVTFLILRTCLTIPKPREVLRF